MDLPTRIGPSITIYRRDLNLGPLTARDYSKVMRNAGNTAARTFVNEAPARKIGLQPKIQFFIVAGGSPTPCDRGDDAAERVHIARVDHFSG